MERLRLPAALLLVLALATLVVAAVVWALQPHGGAMVCDFYTYDPIHTRLTMTPPPGWIETKPGSDCWITPY